jgi:hypothetical protein
MSISFDATSSRAKESAEPTGSGTSLSFTTFLWAKRQISKPDFSWILTGTVSGVRSVCIPRGAGFREALTGHLAPHSLVQTSRAMSEGTRSGYTRRRFLGTTISASGASLLLRREAAAGPQELRTYNGGTDPYPIPWLDKNGSHNQPAGPQLEPSHIYHFKGRVGRCADFVGIGTDNKGNRIAFGTPTTDYGFMEGEYFAGRTAQTGAFTHI